jgi:nitrite reductase/ring-hydroxylating ferredoxin subunit
VTCPWHSWTYDVTTGISPDDADCAVDSYEVKVDGDNVLIGV